MADAGLVLILPTGAGADRVGGKAASLSALMRAGAPVPAACVIPAGESADPGALAAALTRIGPGPYAVRSSGLAEDGEISSFAGMHETLLGVVTRDLPAAIAHCRASSESDRARAYRAATGADDRGVAVIVQRMVAPLRSGVLFTCDPHTGLRDRIVIEVRGLGERLVSGDAEPDRFVLAEDGALRDRIDADGSGLTEPEIASLIEWARRIAPTDPVDIEWAIDADQLWLLQARPVTARARRRAIYTNTNAAELFPEPLPPLAFAMARRYVRALLGELLDPFGTDSDALGVIGDVHGRVYFNLVAVLGWVRTFPLGRRLDGTVFARLLGGSDGALAAALADLRDSDYPNVGGSKARLLWGALKSQLHTLRWAFADPAPLLRLQRAQTDALRADLAKLDDASLIAYVDRVSSAPLGPNGLLASCMPGVVGAELLPHLCQRWTGSRGDAAKLLGGGSGAASATAARDLAAIAGRVEPALLRAADDEPAFLSVLAAHGIGEDWRRWLDAHGHHAHGELDVSVPRWREDWRTARGLLLGAAPSSPRAEPSPPPLRGLRGAILRFVARATRRALVAREDAKSEAVRRWGLLRDALREAGRRAHRQGALAIPDDVFLLHPDELPAAISGQAPPLSSRRAKLDRQRAARPPSVWVEGGPQPRVAPLTDGALRGLPVSAGVAEGPARVLLRAGDGEALLPGEILVAPSTDPGWAPLFLSAAGLVTELGGMLSHGSVVARELGLPAVANVPRATTRIATGERIRVDGDRGTVEKLP